MADDQEKAAADNPADAGADELDLEAMGLENVELTEEEQVAIAAAGARPARKTAAAEPVDGKGRPTAKRRQQGTTTDEHRRSTPVEFVQEAVAELRKVVWPTASQTQQYFVVVLVFVLFMIGIVSALDLAFGTLLLRIFG